MLFTKRKKRKSFLAFLFEPAKKKDWLRACLRVVSFDAIFCVSVGGWVQLTL